MREWRQKSTHLNLSLEEGEWSASRSSCFSSGERALVIFRMYMFMNMWVGRGGEWVGGCVNATKSEHPLRIKSTIS